MEEASDYDFVLKLIQGRGRDNGSLTLADFSVGDRNDEHKVLPLVGMGERHSRLSPLGPQTLEPERGLYWILTTREISARFPDVPSFRLKVMWSTFTWTGPAPRSWEIDQFPGWFCPTASRICPRGTFLLTPKSRPPVVSMSRIICFDTTTLSRFSSARALSSLMMKGQENFVIVPDWPARLPFWYSKSYCSKASEVKSSIIAVYSPAGHNLNSVSSGASTFCCMKVSGSNAT